MKLIIASNNKKKTAELQQLLKSFEILTLTDVGISDDIPETGNSFAENALQKARYVYERTNQNVVADDSGLEVEALNNEPGIYSARYAGEQKSDEKNIEKLLTELKDKSNRKAKFRTVIALIYNGKEILFEGEISGNIITEKRGIKGFGYDPVFVPEGYVKTFAELPSDIKNSISHRAKAINKMKSFFDSFLTNQNPNENFK